MKNGEKLVNGFRAPNIQKWIFFFFEKKIANEFRSQFLFQNLSFLFSFFSHLFLLIPTDESMQYFLPWFQFRLLWEIVVLKLWLASLFHDQNPLTKKS